ncbi:MAG: hypothetical protein OXI60_00470 [Acidiferrobacterales bacterium]|nr:hypothetical protein [Acidiferrobacterales bacterium]
MEDKPEYEVSYFPVIELSSLRRRARHDLLSVGEQICDAAQQYGFFYVKNHGIDGSVIDSVFETARDFFTLPDESKIEVAVSESHRGFLGIGASTMEGYRQADLKESYIWGLDIDADSAEAADERNLLAANRWPESLPGMRKVLNNYFAATHECARDILEAVAIYLGEEQDHFSKHFRRPTSRGSLIYYPPNTGANGEYGVSPHTDFGCLSLLCQRSSGLRVQTPQGEWHRADPISDTFVVNIGDLLARWTNDRFVSVPHCVVNENSDARYSVVVFVDPDSRTLIDPVVGDGESTLYEPIESDIYISGRFDRSFAYRN